ncbi:hypothetical protein V7157_08990 [Neobacillus drentensis]
MSIIILMKDKSLEPEAIFVHHPLMMDKISCSFSLIQVEIGRLDD